MRAQVTHPTAADALGLRAQLIAAADNDLGQYLARNDQTARSVISHTKRSGGRYTTDAPWAVRQRTEIRLRIVNAITALGDTTAYAIADTAHLHVTCVYKHLPAIIADGRVICITGTQQRIYRAAPVADKERP